MWWEWAKILTMLKLYGVFILHALTKSSFRKSRDHFYHNNSSVTSGPVTEVQAVSSSQWCLMTTDLRTRRPLQSSNHSSRDQFAVVAWVTTKPTPTHLFATPVPQPRPPSPCRLCLRRRFFEPHPPAPRTFCQLFKISYFN